MLKRLPSRGAVIPLLLGYALVLHGCTEAGLLCVDNKCQSVPAKALDNKLETQGNACTADPNSVGYPYKILFIVDVSGSTAQSDPTNGRGPAVQQVLTAYASNPEVYFAIISFDTQPNLLETQFTQDQTLLQSVVGQLDLNLNSTNYLDTLTAAYNIIKADADALSPTERARTRYDIEWLSDGVPNPCAQLVQVTNAEQNVLNLIQSEGLFDIRLSTIYLTGAPDSAATCGPTPVVLMQAMANLGRGTYQQLAGNQLKFQIDFSNILQPFSKQNFYVVNESRVVKNNQLYADSDRDGVSDADEITLGLDPTRPDSHGDGCSDRTISLTTLNAGVCDTMCGRELAGNGNNVAALADQDADGVNDCEENILGTLRIRADTDGDNLIDPLEMRFGTNANDPATLTSDSDLDGVVDALEIQQGTDPLTAEKDRHLAYVYDPVVSTPSSVTGTSCFNFNVTNVQLVETMATPTSKAGDNLICIYVEQLPAGDSSSDSEATVSRACFVANYQERDGVEVKLPADGQAVFNPNDFLPITCGSAPCKTKAPAVTSAIPFQ